MILPSKILEKGVIFLGQIKISWSCLFHLMFLQAPRAEILQEASLYIRFLEEERARLEMLKMSSAQVTANSSSISVTLSDSNLAVFAITSSIRRNLVTNIISVFGRHRAEILAANVVAQAGWMSMTVTAAVNDVADGAIEKIKQDILMVWSMSGSWFRTLGLASQSFFRYI